MIVWVSRDNEVSYTSKVKIWDCIEAPVLRESLLIRGFKKYDGDEDAVLDFYCAKNFKKKFGFTPRKESCHKYELSLKKLGD